MCCTLEYIPYSERYAEDTVLMWRESKEAAIGVPERHDFSTHLKFLKNELISRNSVYLCIDTNADKVVGLMALADSELNQLYVHIDYQRRGIGTGFIQLAKKLSPEKLELFSFEVNIKAQAFYRHHGFFVIGQGYENEENMPDIRYRWRA